jgi:hypothetical protein
MKFSKLGMGEQVCMGEGVDHSVGMLSGTVELLCWWEGTFMVSGFKLAAIKRNKDINCGNKTTKMGTFIE